MYYIYMYYIYSTYISRQRVLFVFSLYCSVFFVLDVCICWGPKTPRQPALEVMKGGPLGSNEPFGMASFQRVRKPSQMYHFGWKTGFLWLVKISRTWLFLLKWVWRIYGQYKLDYMDFSIESSRYPWKPTLLHFKDLWCYRFFERKVYGSGTFPLNCCRVLFSCKDYWMAGWWSVFVALYRWNPLRKGLSLI